MAWWGAIGILIFLGCVLNLNKIRSIWYANIGAVIMERVELNGFPTNEWAGQKHIAELEIAELALLSSLQFDPYNQTSTYRLGLISLAQRDFPSALVYLLEAHRQSPQHRGVIKSLGYCYVWLGDMASASAFLENIPEAKSELAVYVWWWGTQERSDLSEYATMMSSVLDTVQPQP